MALRRRGQHWYADYYADGKRVVECTGTANRREAEKFLALRVSEVQRGVFIKPVSITLAELGERYMEHAELHKRSWKRDEQLLRDLRVFFGNPTLRDITPPRIEEFQQARAKEVAPATVNRATAMLKHMFFQAEKWGMHSRNPVRMVQFLREDNLKCETLSEEQEKKLVAVAPPYVQDLVLFAVNTGLRTSDIFNLKWTDVDLERRELTLVVKKNGKVHELPLNTVAFEVVSRQRRVCEYVFTHPMSGQKIKSVRGALVTAVKRAGLKKVTWHMFRHTIATRLLETTDLVTVKEILGHESIKTTLRYAHTSADRKRRAVDNLNGGHGDKIVTIVPRKKVG